MSAKRTLVAGGTVATDYGVFPADVLIEDDHVVSLPDHGDLNGADEVIDATGLVVMPGAIDPHAHFEDPGHTEREDFTTGTMSAAAGGITTVIEHPLTYPPVTTTELYREKREMARQKVVVDFGLWGALTPPSLPEIRDQWRDGAIGFKAFMPFSEPAYPHVMDAEFLAECARSRRSAASCSCTRRTTRCSRPASRACSRRDDAIPWRTMNPDPHHRRGGGAPRPLSRCRGAGLHSDRPRLEPGQRRARAARKGGRPARLHGDLPPSPVA